MSAKPLVFGSLLLATLVTAAGQTQPARGQEQEPRAGVDAQGPLRFRRVFAPADRLEDLPRDHDRLVPMPAEEFERLVSAMGSGPAEDGLVAGVVSARYQAKLDGDRLVDGEATLEIFHSGEGETLLPLDPCGLAISAADWLGADARPAVLGLADDGRLTVLASERGSSKKLRLAWSLAGHRDENGTIEFPLQLPACGAAQMVLELPAGLTPLVEHGVVSRQASAESEVVRWRIELGGRRKSVLRIVPEEHLEAGPRWTRLRQSLVYDFSLRGAEVAAELQLDAYGEPLNRIAFELDPGLQLVTAQYGTAAVRWTVAGAAHKGAPTRVVLELPEPIQGTGRSLRLTAWVPLMLDRPWQLPGIRARDVFWQEGTASLLVPDPLVLEQLSVRDGRQSKTGSLSGPRSGQQVEVQYFTPQAAVEVALSHPKAPIEVSLGTAVELGGQQVAALTTAALQLPAGQRFELQADVGRRWIVDSLESVPADALDDWTIQRGKTTAARKLRVRLAKPLSAARPIRLLVRARRLDATLARGFTAEDLVPLEFPGAKAARQLAWVRAADAYQVNVVEIGPSARVDPQTLGAEALALFTEPPRAPLFEQDRGGGWHVFLERQKPVYSAEIRVEASVSDGVLWETYRIACVPQGARVERLLVRFSHARDEPLEWTLGAEGEDQLIAERLPPPDGQASKTGGETWQVELHPPRSVPFEIRASRAFKLSGPQPVSLAALPEASNQQGTVVVGSTGKAALRIENRRLEPIPTKTVPDDQVNLARASFRYDPVKEIEQEGIGDRGLGFGEEDEHAPSNPESPNPQSPNAQPPVSNSPAVAALTVACQPPGKAPASAWAWSCRLQSWWEPDGTGRHLAVYQLESTGQKELRVDLPGSSNLDSVRGVWVDRARAAWRPRRDGPGGVVVALPEGRRYPVVAIHFETAGRPLEWVDSIAPPFPKVHVPVLVRQWTVWLPPGYDWRDPDRRWLLEPRGEPSWTERLFGPVGRRAGQLPFDPVRSADLSELVGSPAGEAVAADPADPAGGQGVRRIESPWTDAELAELAPDDTVGWNEYELEVPWEEPISLGIVHRETMRAIGLAVLLGTLALVVWLAADRPAVLVSLAGVFGVAALALPETYAGLASSVVLGVLLGIGVRLIRRRAKWMPSGDGSDEERSSLIRAAGELGILALAVTLTLLLAGSAFGQEAGPPAAAAGSSVYNVFIPVDKDDRPSGDMYQVPETLYNELHRRAAAKAEGPQGWLLVGAEYRGALNWQAGGERLTLDQLSATFEIQVFGKRRTVALPLGGEAVQLAPEGALLDGRVVQPRWIEQGRLLAFDVAGDQPQHRLDLALRPTVQTDGSYAGFDLRIPPWAGSRVELTVPSDAPQVEVLSAAGPVARQHDPERVDVQLGPSDRLAVRWPERGGRASSSRGAAVDVEELLWLKVRDGSVVLDGRFRFTPAQGYLSRLELVADPRLRLLPRENSGPAIAAVEATPTQPQTIRFDLAQPTSEPVVLNASFLLRESSGVGNLRLPHLAARGARSVKRWLAVWVDPSLETLPEEDPTPLERLAPSEFEAAWGPAEVRSQSAYVLPPGETTWSITTRPRAAKTTAEQSLALGFGEDDVQVDYSAKLATSDGYRFQYQVAAPPQLEVETVSLKADATEQVARWSRAPEGPIVVFLTGPVSGEQQLEIRGRLAMPPKDLRSPPADRKRMPLPVVRLEGVDTETLTIDLLRKPTVGLSVARSEGLADVESRALDPRFASWGRPVQSLRHEGSGPIEATVEVTANRPKVTAEQTTFVRFDGESWEADVRIDLHVAGGLLDEFRLSVPGEFAGPYRLEPAATFEQSGQDPRELIIRPPAAVTGDYRLSIRSPLEFGPGDRVRAPEVAVSGVELTGQLLVLPTQLELEPAVWETEGLSKTPLPDGIVPPQVAAESFVAYRAEGPKFEAVLGPSQGGVAQVQLADVRLAWQADGSCFVATTFDLEPAGPSQCRLRLPAGFRLVAVAVADVPAAAIPAEGRTWDVPLGPGGYPRRVDVLMAGRLPPADANGRRTFEAPQLEGLTAGRTLWTISGPAICARGVPEGIREATQLEQTRLRLEHVRQAIQRTAETASGERVGTDHWCRLWTGRFVGLRNALERLWQENGRSGSGMEAWTALVSADTLPPQAAALVGSGPAEGAESAGSPWSALGDPIWLGPWQKREPPLRCVTEDGASSLAVSYQVVRSGGLWPRWLAPAVLAGLTLLGVLAVRSGFASALFCRWPYLVGVVVGLGWWLWLRPSVLGWVIVGVSLAASARSGWRKRRSAGSVIIPLSSVQR